MEILTGRIFPIKLGKNQEFSDFLQARAGGLTPTLSKFKFLMMQF